MRTGLIYGVLAAFLVLSGLSWADTGTVPTGQPLDTLALETAAKYGPLAVAIVLAAMQIGRSLSSAIGDAVEALQAGKAVISVKLECPHLDHLRGIQRHLDRDEAHDLVRDREVDRRLGELEAGGSRR